MELVEDILRKLLYDWCWT